MFFVDVLVGKLLVKVHTGMEKHYGHFIISNSLLNSVNHSDVRDDVDNHSDHLPITLYMYLYVPIAIIAASNIRQYLPKPKWFCVDKEMLQKYKYELDQQLGSIPPNEFLCNHTHENYKCQIQLLHDHLIHSCMLAAERTISFTKPTPNNIGIKPGGMSTLAKSSFMHYIGIDCTFNMAVSNLVLSLKCKNYLDLFITRK